jgi:hypothetical protein
MIPHCATAGAASALAGLAFLVGRGPVEHAPEDAGTGPDGVARSMAEGPAVHPGFIYGRVTTVDGVGYEGRLRFGGSQEAFWGDYFNGFKDGNPWVALVPDGALDEHRGIEVLGMEIGFRRRRGDLGRQHMSRFGDIAKIEARGRDLTVTLRSGTVVELNRYAADDFADGVRVWDVEHGVVDLGEGRVRTIEFVASPRADAAPPHRLRGTVRTRSGDPFSGYVQWDREGSIGTDSVVGYAGGDELVGLGFDTIRSIERDSSGSSAVTLIDGREIVLSGTRDVGEGNAGLFVDDQRYGRVLISWQAFQRIDFRPADAGTGDGGPAYADIPAGRPLTGTVTTRTGRSITGRLVYDLDESEVTETLDAPSGGVDHTSPSMCRGPMSS